MRGEEERNHTGRHSEMELPPHARRRVGWSLDESRIYGITSACAEKRTLNEIREIFDGNYLRMRGEETALPAETLAVGVVL